MLDGLDVVYSQASGGRSAGEIRDSVGRLTVTLRGFLVGPRAACLSYAGAGVIGSIFAEYLEPVLRKHGITLVITDAARAAVADAFATQIEKDRQATGRAITDEGRKTLLYGIVDAAGGMPEELMNTLKKEIEERFIAQSRLAPTSSEMGARL